MCVGTVHNLLEVGNTDAYKPTSAVSLTESEPRTVSVPSGQLTFHCLCKLKDKAFSWYNRQRHLSFARN